MSRRHEHEWQECESTSSATGVIFTYQMCTCKRVNVTSGPRDVLEPIVYTWLALGYVVSMEPGARFGFNKSAGAA